MDASYNILRRGFWHWHFTHFERTFGIQAAL